MKQSEQHGAMQSLSTSSNKTTIIACFNLNEVSWQAPRRGLKLSSKKICKNPTVRYVNTKLAAAKFVNAIELPRYLMLNSIRLVLIHASQYSLAPLVYLVFEHAPFLSLDPKVADQSEINNEFQYKTS
ncbi:hypothetical protein BB561_005613, partial [Smittium simulii]